MPLIEQQQLKNNLKKGYVNFSGITAPIEFSVLQGQRDEAVFNLQEDSWAH